MQDYQRGWGRGLWEGLVGEGLRGRGLWERGLWEGLVGEGLVGSDRVEGKDGVNGGRSGLFFYIISIIIASLAGVC